MQEDWVKNGEEAGTNVATVFSGHIFATLIMQHDTADPSGNLQQQARCAI
tara:strand:- start:69436 stop:69585 length:150 start_codon:yes stop_codon:yes gene_type:complete